MARARVRARPNVTLEIGAGDYVALTGPSGAGKSTLLALIGGLDRPRQGAHPGNVDGREMSHLTGDGLAAYRRQTVGFVFQHFGLVDLLTATENVELRSAWRSDRIDGWRVPRPGSPLPGTTRSASTTAARQTRSAAWRKRSMGCCSRSIRRTMRKNVSSPRSPMSWRRRRRWRLDTHRCLRVLYGARARGNAGSSVRVTRARRDRARLRGRACGARSLGRCAYKRLGRQRYVLVTGPGERAVAELLDRWSVGRFDPSTQVVSLGVMRPTSGLRMVPTFTGPGGPSE